MIKLLNNATMINVINLTKQTIPQIPFDKIKKEILDKDYELSIVLAGSKKMRKLNKQYRNKDKAADTLSFSFSKTEGEIFIHAKETPERMRELFVHSLIHLKGLKHGKKMEKEEKYWQNRLKLQ